MAEQYRDLVRQQRRDGVKRVVSARSGDGQIEIGELRGKRFDGARSVLVKHRMGSSPPA